MAVVNGNGNGITASRLVWWLMTTVVSLLVMGAAGWAAHISGSIGALQHNLDELDNGRQINAQNIQEMRGDYKTITYRLDRIEKKLDSAIGGN